MNKRISSHYELSDFITIPFIHDAVKPTHLWAGCKAPIVLKVPPVYTVLTTGQAETSSSKDPSFPALGHDSVG